MPAVNKCTYCRDPCVPTDEQPSTSEFCPRCIKNERKYGKPSVCQYCQLPAAFLGKLCHLCSHYKKRYGLPVQCRHCKLKAAFDKRPPHLANVKKTLLCRLCKMTYSKSLAVVAEKQASAFKHVLSPEAQQSDSAAKKIDQSEQSSSSSSMTSRQKFASKFEPTADSFAAKFKFNADLQENKDSLNEHNLLVNELKDEILSLKRLVQSKIQERFERDKKITDLKAQLMLIDKEHRFKVQEMQKQHQNTVEILQDRVRSLTKELACCKRSAKKE